MGEALIAIGETRRRQNSLEYHKIYSSVAEHATRATRQLGSPKRPPGLVPGFAQVSVLLRGPWNVARRRRPLVAGEKDKDHQPYAYCQDARCEQPVVKAIEAKGGPADYSSIRGAGNCRQTRLVVPWDYQVNGWSSHYREQIRLWSHTALRGSSGSCAWGELGSPSFMHLGADCAW